MRTSMPGGSIQSLTLFTCVMASVHGSLIVKRARRLQRFLTQPFAVTSQFTGRKGASVSIEDTLDGCEAILNGETDDWEESALYMVGTLDEVRERAAGEAA